MRILVVRLTNEAALTFLAVDENGTSLEDNTIGWRLKFDEMLEKVNAIAHRYCIDTIVPVVNDYGIALLHYLRQGKYADRIYWNASSDMVQPADHVPVGKYGWFITANFMHLLPTDPSDLSGTSVNEEILRKIADKVRAETFQNVVATIPVPSGNPVI